MGSYKLKVVLTGEPEKTNIVREFAFGYFQTNYKLTIGCDIFTSHIIANNEQDYISLSIWDVSSQERFKYFRKTFYRGAAGAIIVYDSARYSTFKEVINWAREILKVAGNIPIVIFGNVRGELSRMISREEAEQLTNHMNNLTSCQYFENSDYKGFERALSYLTSEMHLNQTKVRLDPSKIVHVPFRKVENAKKISLQEILDNLNVTIINDEALIFKYDHYFRVKLETGEVFIHSIDNEEKCANICLVAGFDGWTNTSLNQFKVGLIAKISAIVWDDLPRPLYPQISDFLLHGKGGPNLFPKDKIH